MPRRIHTDAVVLKRSEFGESDRIVTLLTCDQGILRALAPAARKSKKRFGGCLELFTRIEASITDKGAGKLARMEEAALRDSHEAIKTDLLSSAFGSDGTSAVGTRAVIYVPEDRCQESEEILHQMLDHI